MTDTLGSIETPWQVRWVRFWWLREARRQRASGDTETAARSVTYARGVRSRWLETGAVPVAATTRERALEIMSGRGDAP